MNELEPVGGDTPPVGVLALQGDFALHRGVLETLGLGVREVRSPVELEGLTGLILPGGESTTMLKLMEQTGMEAAIVGFHAGGGALFGTCAGLILLGKRVTGPAQRSLGLLDVDVARNAYGRQADSFETTVEIPSMGAAHVGFIRAPKITRVGEGVTVLAHHDGHPVLVRQDRVLAATFHPELTGETALHRYFAGEVLGIRPVYTLPVL